MHRRRLTISVVTGLLATVLGAVALSVAAEAAEPVAAGDPFWEPVADWPLIPIHMALDSKGRVVSYGTNGDGTQTGRFIYDVWTPTGAADQNHSTLQNTTQTDLFCSLQLNRADTGDMLLFGGDNWTGSSTTNTGNDDINLFDADNSTLRQLPGMNRNRWYATGITLIDGSIYIQGGDQGPDHPERWTPDDGAQLLDLDTSRFNYWYPRNWVTPSGAIFGFDADYNMYTISPDLGTLTGHGQLPWRSDTGRSSTAVMYQPGKILLFGGTTRTATIIDVTGPTPVATRTADLTYQRSWGNATVLPDGRVLATGGADRPSDTFDSDPLSSFNVAYNAEIWDPDTGEWTVLPRASQARLYHSTAVLLADGRVLTGGGGAPGPVTNTNAEVFWPDYLSQPDGSPADRPTITSMPDTGRAGDRLALTVDHDRPVGRVTLIKTGSVTHSFDMEQRFIEAAFSASGNQVTVDLPSSGNVMTPGFYHVFVLDDQGVPSVARMLRVEPSGELPTEPLSVEQTAGGTGGDAFLDWPADDTSLTSIEVRHGAWLRSLEAITTDGTLGRHGGTGDTLERVTIERGEYVTAIFGTASTFVNSIGFETSAGRTLGPFGNGGGAAYRIEAPPGYHAVGFKGASGTLIDRVGIVIQQRPDPVPDPDPVSASIGGAVVDQSGSGVDGVKLNLFTERRQSFLGRTFTDAAGGFTFENLDPGCYVVTFIAPDGASFGGGRFVNRAACVESGEQVTDLNASLLVVAGGDETALGGAVFDAAGDGEPDVRAVLFRAEPSGRRIAFLGRAFTDGSGSYRFDVQPGCYTVVLVAPDGDSFTTGTRFQERSVCITEGQTALALNGRLTGRAPLAGNR